jgi:hypothetical protein
MHVKYNFMFNIRTCLLQSYNILEMLIEIKGNILCIKYVNKIIFTLCYMLPHCKDGQIILVCSVQQK